MNIEILTVKDHQKSGFSKKCNLGNKSIWTLPELRIRNCSVTSRKILHFKFDSRLGSIPYLVFFGKNWRLLRSVSFIIQISYKVIIKANQLIGDGLSKTFHIKVVTLIYLSFPLFMNNNVLSCVQNKFLTLLNQMYPFILAVHQIVGLILQFDFLSDDG